MFGISVVAVMRTAYGVPKRGNGSYMAPDSALISRVIAADGAPAGALPTARTGCGAATV